MVLAVSCTAMIAAGWYMTRELPSLGACGFKNMTGRPCPGCGMTRSITSVYHLQIADSLRYHAFGPILLAALLALGTYGWVGALRPRPSFALLDAPWLLPTLLLFLVTYIAYWGIRLAVGVEL